MSSDPSGDGAARERARTRASMSWVLVAVAVAVALGLLYFLRSLFVPFFTALLLIALINGLVRLLAQRWPTGPRWALLIIAALIIALLLAGCVVALSYGGARLVADAPALAGRVDDLVDDASHAVGLTQPPRLTDVAGAGWVVSIVRPVVAGLSNLFAGATLTILFLGFMLASRALLARKLDILAGTAERADRFRLVLDRISRSAGDYMWVQTVTGALYASASGLALHFIGLDNVLFWTILIFLLSYIPVLGVAVASIAPALFALIQFPTYWQAIAVFAAVQVFASLVGNVLLPKMQADKQNIDPTISLLAVGLWTLMWGIPGAFLAIPLTVMLMIVFDQFDETRWAAILISNDGVPSGNAALGGSRVDERQTVTEVGRGPAAG